MPEQTRTEVRREVVILRQDRFAELCDARGWTNRYQRAQALGVRHTTLRRLEYGGHPGSKLIGQVLATLGVPFEAVFDRRSA